MTTPSPNTPAPAARSRHGRLWAGLAALGVTVACAGAALSWPGEDGGEPRVNDTRAGVSYSVPEGWRHDAAADRELIGAFSSRISRTSDAAAAEDATVLTGAAGRPVPSAELRRTAEGAARSNAAFFFPDAAPTLTESRRTELGGRPAHTVALDVPHDGGTARVELTVVAAPGDHAAFLLALASDAGDADVLADVHAVEASVALG
ncbi:hypothetical protein [Streptomyces sp. BV129]|uniref:hypothetical protein n=1 Tax=Streptomyces sp. BV129 TaxID=2849671 RepID=UPI001C2EBC40|nr:hypothetical protein [Streptomyces sp. BV129]MBV1946929.1 hypothetical protein [Streptomyces sp. BV129]